VAVLAWKPHSQVTIRALCRYSPMTWRRPAPVGLGVRRYDTGQRSPWTFTSTGASDQDSNDRRGC
jgi:hypothetical protein